MLSEALWYARVVILIRSQVSRLYVGRRLRAGHKFLVVGLIHLPSILADRLQCLERNLFLIVLPVIQAGYRVLGANLVTGGQ